MADAISAVTTHRRPAVQARGRDTVEADRSIAALWPAPAPTDALTRPDATSSDPTEKIYSRAMAIVDKKGAKALTLRDIAADLRISTRTLHKRVGSRDELLRCIARTFAEGLDVSIRVKESWRATSLEWCRQLHHALIAHPQLSVLLDDTVNQPWARTVENLADLAVHEGIPRARAQECLRPLVHVTVNDALAHVRAAVHDASAPALQRIADEQDFMDTLRLMLDGMQERRRAGATPTSPPTKTRRKLPPAPDRSHLAKMDRAGQISFAWALVDAVKPYLNDAERVWLVTKIGAGDVEDAIFNLLRCVERNRAGLPTSMLVEVQRWLNGYLGSDREAFLRSLIDELRFV